jgi:hypothetical protein
MDPIHPITPRPAAIPEIAPARSERAARDRREQRRQAVDRDAPRREHRDSPSEHPDSQSPSEEDEPRHIDVHA